jgi:hypothetical protein
MCRRTGSGNREVFGNLDLNTKRHNATTAKTTRIVGLCDKEIGSRSCIVCGGAVVSVCVGKGPPDYME